MFFLLRGVFLVLALCAFKHSTELIDVVIPCSPKDTSTLELCIEGIRSYGSSIRRIIVVSETKLTEHAEWIGEDLYPFDHEKIGRAIFKGDEKGTTYFVKDCKRRGWIYQQLLKLYAPLVIPGISSNVLCIDADVIFFAPVTFMTELGGGLYAVGNEYHLPYFSHMKRLLPSLTRVFPQYSGICHHMLFQKEVICALFSEIEDHHPGKQAWEAICSAIDPQEIEKSSFSEYEIYFNYLFANDPEARIRPLLWKNEIGPSYAGMLRDATQFHFVAYHEHLRRNIQ